MNDSSGSASGAGDKKPGAEAARADLSQESASPAKQVVLDDALNSAEGTRKTARWIASSLGAIPGLAIAASIVRAPGEAGFESQELTAGILLAAVGALVGVLALARVLAPVATEEKGLRGIDVKRIPGHPFASYGELADSIDDFWRLKADADLQVQNAEQKVANATDAELDDAKRELHGRVVHAAFMARQLQRREDIRTGLFRLAASDEVRDRYRTAMWGVSGAVLLVAVGFINLGLAPKEKTESADVSLHVLELNEAGEKALDCTKVSGEEGEEATTRVFALKVGGDDETPKVITLPSTVCPTPKGLEFPTEAPEPLGSAEAP